jgi:transposase
MRTPDAGLAPAYNVQISADAAHGLIADVEVVNDPQDAQQLAPAADRLQETYERYPEQMLADGGYTNNESVLEMAERKVDFYGKFSGRADKLSGRAVRPEGYDRGCFTYEEASNEFVCPEGKRLRHKAVTPAGQGA